MINRNFILLFMLLLAFSCSKSRIDKESEDIKISFSTKDIAADWHNRTRGAAINDFNSVSSIMAYSFITNSNNNVADCYINHKEAIQDNGYWGFTPAYYYPLNESLDFLAYTPMANYSSEDDSNGVIQELDINNKAVNFTYYLPNNGRNHPDLLLATPSKGCNIDNPLQQMEFVHALTQLTMSAKVSSNTEPNRYAVLRFTLNNITTGAALNYNVNDGIGDWSEVSHGAFIVSEIFPDVTLGEERVLLTNSLKGVMSKGNSLFMIPQEIEKKSLAPTIQITLLDTHTGLTYITDKILLPSPNGAGWLMGQHINLQFELDIDKSGVVIPMSFVARLLSWNNTNIDTDVDDNIYVNLDRNEVLANSTLDLMLHTNGIIKNIECNGAISTAILGSSKKQFYYPITITTNGSGLGSVTLNIERKNGKIFSKKFNITVK